MTRSSDARSQVWRNLGLDEREREYSPSSCVGGDISSFITAYVERSAAARDTATANDSPVFELRYGDAPSQTIDVVTPPETNGLTPLLVFIHGGYWQQLSKRESFFAATGCLAHGIAFAAVDYTLAPGASLDDIVTECRNALHTLRSEADRLQIGVDQIVVCGSSAGAHLAAMMGLGLDDGWRPAGVGLVSGIFELEPLIGTSINEAVRLDLGAAQRNSPLLSDLAGFPPAVIAFGSNETNEFKRQSHEMASRLSDAGTDVHLAEVASRNHFDIILDLCDDTTALGQLILNLIHDLAPAS